MKEFQLSPKELTALRLAHKRAKQRSAAYKINAVILLGSGWTLKRVKDALLLDDETLRRYVEKYRSGGIESLLETHYPGRFSQLNESQQKRLMEELDNNIYLTTQSIITYVKSTFNVTYSLSGMRDFLHRVGYVYKRPKLVPGNPDIEAQERFVECYEKFMLEKPSNEVVLFMDAVHPEHNAMAAYGWMKRGSDRVLKTNSGRQRLNLHGAIEAETHEITLIESNTVDQDSTLQLLDLLEKKYFWAKRIHVILDNARYHYSKAVRAFVEDSSINLVFLPPYSPNLNLIEGLWRFFKKKVLYNQYYKNIKAFRNSCVKFFRNIEQYSKEIENFMDADFHIDYST